MMTDLILVATLLKMIYLARDMYLSDVRANRWRLTLQRGLRVVVVMASQLMYIQASSQPKPLFSMAAGREFFRFHSDSVVFGSSFLHPSRGLIASISPPPRSVGRAPVANIFLGLAPQFQSLLDGLFWTKFCRW